MSANEYDFEERMQARYARECFFGLTEIPALLAAGLTGMGVGGTTAGILGGIGAGALEGSALGALTGGLTGGSPLKGAEFGALGGAATAGLGSVFGAGGGAAGGTGGGAGSAAATAPAAGALPVGSALDPTTGVFSSTAAAPTAIPSVSASDVMSQLSPGAGVGGGGIGMTTATGPFTGSGFYGGGPAATGAPTQLGGADSQVAGQTVGSTSTGQIPSTDALLNYGPTTTPDTESASIGGNTAGGGSIGDSFAKSSVGQFWNKPTWENAGNIAASNPGAIVSALGMGYNMMNQGNVKGLNALKAQTQSMQNQSTAMENYLNTGTLPGPLQSGLDQATRNAKQEIKNRYAQLGMSGSTAEASDMAYADVNAQAQKANYELQLYNAGIQEAGTSAGLLKDIIGVNQKQDEATGQAISNFASALGGFPLKTNTQAQTTTG